jgi:hypothetical protein
MKEICGKVKEAQRQEIEFNLPVQKVAYALDVSPEELLEAVDDHKIGYRKITEQDGNVVIQVEAYGRHCTVTVEPKG